MKKSRIENITHELYKAFALFNQIYFNNDLPETAITVQSSGLNRLALGWCTTKEVWGDREGMTKMFEINISAEYIDWDFYETMDTLLHEMVHLYHKLKGIKDTSRNNTYHNKHFRNKVLEIGFEYETESPDKKHGWTHARLSNNAKQFINTLDIDQSVFSIARRGSFYFEQLKNKQGPSQLANPGRRGTLENTNRRKSTFKWTCSNCKLIVRTTKQKANIICGDCKVILQLEI